MTVRKYAWIKINNAVPTCLQLDCGTEVTIKNKKTPKLTKNPIEN